MDRKCPECGCTEIWDEDCPSCDGSGMGNDSDESCEECDGSGMENDSDESCGEVSMDPSLTDQAYDEYRKDIEDNG